MATGPQIKAMMESHAEGDDARFYSIASQVAASEARKGHEKLAREIRELIDTERARAKLPKPKTFSDSVISISRPDGEAAELVSLSTSRQTLDDLIVDEHVKVALQRGIEEQSHLGEILSHGLKPQKTFLLTGPPGCGKTMAASVIANALKLPLLTVRLDAIITRYLGESSSKLRAVFEAIENTRAVYLFDEFDSLGLERGSSQDVAEMRRVLNSFLVFVESYKGNSIVVAATNHAEALDFALFRRFDSLIEFAMPTPEQGFIALKNRLSLLKVPKNLNLKKVSEAGEGLSFADLSRVVDDSLKQVIIGHSKQLSTNLLLGEVQKRKSFLSKNRRV
jgi:SpoVK/Ycf46/Vps4 family AAA+-type ATPase